MLKNESSKSSLGSKAKGRKFYNLDEMTCKPSAIYVFVTKKPRPLGLTSPRLAVVVSSLHGFQLHAACFYPFCHV